MDRDRAKLVAGGAAAAALGVVLGLTKLDIVVDGFLWIGERVRRIATRRRR